MKVKFVPQNVEFEIQSGESVLHVAQDNGIYIKSVCKGVPSCAECRCRVVDGEHNVLQPGPEELSLIGTGHFIDRRRLSCQLKCYGDITIDLSEQVAKQQGLIGGQKKKKLAIKDDRIEDSAIRTNSASESDDDGEENADPVSRGPENRNESRRPEPPRVQKTAEAPSGNELTTSDDDNVDDDSDDDHDESDETSANSRAPAQPRPAGQNQGQQGAGPGQPGGGRRRRRRGGRGGRGGGGGGQPGGSGGGQPGGGRGNGNQPSRGK